MEFCFDELIIEKLDYAQVITINICFIKTKISQKVAQ